MTSAILNEKTDLRAWIIAVVLALVVHVILLAMNVQWHIPLTQPRVEVKQVDMQKLAQIKKQWKEREKSLLLDKKSLPEAKEAPKDARYFSDRNIRVDKEQRAKTTNVIPKSGGVPQTKVTPQKTPLAKLALPLDLTGTPIRKKNTPKVSQQAMAEGGDQAVTDQALPVGSENLLNAQESIYYSYYSRIYESIGPVWQSKIREVPFRRRISQGDYVTAVDVVFDEYGNLLDIRTLKSSGIRDFDDAVNTSWYRIKSFPNPPRALLNEQKEVHTGWTFCVQVGDGFNVEYLPPERNY